VSKRAGGTAAVERDEVQKNRHIGAIPAPKKGGTVEVQPKKPSAKGPAAWFTGDLWIDAIAQG
jgi:hypothetical protein